MRLFKANDYSNSNHFKTVNGCGKKQSEENIVKSIRNLFKQKKEMKQ